MMNSSALRKAFLEFFAKRGHEVVPSASLVPQNDPTLMFVNAGMVPFKDVFTGKDERPYSRACSSQKCIRISGKHNDLENVGVTARHQTFFEMLGNFSFGDYFKEEAIVSAWDLLVGEWKIPTDRLVITVFEGGEGVPADDEAAALWKKVTGFGDDRIVRMGAADNFWSMGDTGPCGPCSEIHFFHGDKPDPSTFGEEPGIDGKGWTEIWNLVFMQFDRKKKGAAPEPLPAPSIDTGAGLERVAGVIQGVTSNYDTDLMRRLVDKAAELSGKRYTASGSDQDVSMRVIADHARTTAFLMAEGIMPDKQKKEYVLRRVMRRAIRHGHRLGIEVPFLHEVALEVVDAMGADYPELVERKELIRKVTEGEEVRFRRTLKNGVKILDGHFAAMSSKDETSVTAEMVADLYTTYGFPPDLTAVIAAEQGYRAELKGAWAIIKSSGDADGSDGPIDPAAALDQAYRDVAAKVEATTFNGYDSQAGSSRVVAIIEVQERDGTLIRKLVEQADKGARVEIAVAETPFYAESGGQVGDRGSIRGDGLEMVVLDVQKPFGGVHLHHARIEKGRVKVGDSVDLVVDDAARSAIRRNHSATHLLHWALKEVLGEHAMQKGSLVGPDVLRFDFAHNQAMTSEEVAAVEQKVNAKILTNAPVQTDVLGIAEARAKGAVAIFEEKYGDVVRVLTMTSDSVELCGGTHCQRLGDIGLFKITSEGGTAAGVRRILAATGHNAHAFIRELQDEVRRARVAAKATTGGDLAGKIDKIVQSERALERKLNELQKKLLEGSGAGGGLDAMLANKKTVGELTVVGVRLPDGTNMGSLRELVEKLRDKLGDKAVAMAATKNGDKAQLAITVSKAATKHVKAGALIKAVAVHVGGSGGGRPDMAQAGGNNPDGLDAAVAAIYDEVAKAVG
jgi:alanyl-tRNA synthetase